MTSAHPSLSKIASTNVVKNISCIERTLAIAVAENASLNPLADLLQLALVAADAQDTFKAIYSLYRVFVLIISSKKHVSSRDDVAAKVVAAWIWDRLKTYVEFLASLLQDEEKILRTSALKILFSLQKCLSLNYSELEATQPQFHISHFRKVVQALLLCPPSTRPYRQSKSSLTIYSDVLNHFYDAWFSVYDDIRWFFLRESATLLLKTSDEMHPRISVNLFAILERLSTFPTEQSELDSWWVPEIGVKPPNFKHIGIKTSRAFASSSDDDVEEHDSEDKNKEDDWRIFFDDEPAADKKRNTLQGVRLHKMTLHQSLHSLASHRAVFTRTWLSLLPRLSMFRNPEETKGLAIRVLSIMHRCVIPHLTRPILVMDWIGVNVDQGGSVGLLALNALFVLMKEYNLDYPSFYTRLYAFLDRDVLHSKHRARFFRLTELFLSSTHLPATVLASFIKRLSRLSLTAPPAAIVMIVPFTYNVLKQHPSLMPMIHRADCNDNFEDPFLASEPNPLATQALESSIWELISHRVHYHASVSTLCKIFSEAFTKPRYAMEDFLDHTYGTLFDTEVNWKIKTDPPLALELSKSSRLFPLSSEQGDEVECLVENGDVVCQLWVLA